MHEQIDGKARLRFGRPKNFYSRNTCQEIENVAVVRK